MIFCSEFVFMSIVQIRSYFDRKFPLWLVWRILDFFN